MKQWLLRKEALWAGGMLALFAGYLAFGDSTDPCRDDAVGLAAAAGHGSDPLAEGEHVTVEGVVTGEFLGGEQLNGFFMQAEGGEGGPAALFVYAPGLDEAERQRVRPGVVLQVQGITDRFHGRPQIGQVDTIYRCGRPGRPEPKELTLPLTQADRDRFEGLLVRTTAPLTVTGNYQLGRHGTLKLAPERAYRQRSGDDPGSRVLLDDGSYRGAPEPVPYLDADSGTRRVGDRVNSVEGILTYAFDRWRLHPVEPPEFEVANPRPEAPEPVDGTARVAAFNVENYFLTLGERGAANHKELEGQRGRLLPALRALDADLLGLVEVENDPDTLKDLVRRASEAADGPPYRAVIGGATGGDAIKVSLAYRPERIELVDGPFRDSDPVHHRPPQAAVFQPHGEAPFLAVVVHFKSKIGCPSSGDVDRGQGCWNERRTTQAESLARFVHSKLTQTGTGDAVLLGDFNSYAGEDPIRALAEAGFLDIVAEELPPERQYTYVFRGASGTLDYALANESMAARVTGATVWHINADEPPVFGYDGRLAEDPAAAGQPFRSSDHDPVLLGIDPNG
ncbi:ExeM/NucH family extracellular endonuclease [Aquisalimonas sp.]|uniref:ExeM/NucH family extracellular endonuclease n=1 Tax=Aquisalimonas sp. TaxID=1872621 RepID=UPI0025C3BC16|nr:ExeM/NucH family extracellular endonuclease [Aquisalimonas sp.]